MAIDRRRAGLAAAMAVAVQDVLAQWLTSSRARVITRFATAAALLRVARAAGVSWAELGLGRHEVGRGARLGTGGGACAVAFVCAGALMPVTRPLYLEDRGAAGGRNGILAAELARILFAAVPAEELTYRSVLLGLRMGDGREGSAVAWTSVLFGLSHILPTLSTMSSTAVKRHLGQGPVRQILFVGGNVAVTSLAGGVFACLRLRSGSVLAPVLVHAALNGSALLAARAVHGGQS
jgi:CAAX protease family protein